MHPTLQAFQTNTTFSQAQHAHVIRAVCEAHMITSPSSFTQKLNTAHFTKGSTEKASSSCGKATRSEFPCDNKRPSESTIAIAPRCMLTIRPAWLPPSVHVQHRHPCFILFPDNLVRIRFLNASDCKEIAVKQIELNDLPRWQTWRTIRSSFGSQFFKDLPI